MNSGFLTFATRGKAFKSIGIHQKFDREAYRLLSPLVNHAHFPLRKQILNFEGVGGPDGLKLKDRHKYKADHNWDPVNKIGYLPLWIEIHHKNLVEALRDGDIIKAAFEAGFMAHYTTDSLTPAHHMSPKLITAEYEHASKIKKGWVQFGPKGLFSSHVVFETGIASANLFSPIRSKFDHKLADQIREKGIRQVIEEESLRVAKHDLYYRYLKRGWSASLAKSIREVVIKRTPQLISAAWLVAYEQAGYTVKQPVAAKQPITK